MPVKINGLPAHVLLVHAVVVLLPVAAVMLVASALWPAARAKLGFLTPAVAFVALALVPVTTHAGEWLQHNLGFHSKAIERHAELGDELLPWAAGIFVMSVVVWVLHRRYDQSWRRSGRAGTDTTASDRHAEPDQGAGRGGTATLTRPETATRTVLPLWVTSLVALLSVVVAVGGAIQLYRIGDSGAQAVWSGIGKR